MKLLKKNQLQGILLLIIILVVGSSLLSMTRGVEKSVATIKISQKETENSGLLVGRSNRKIKYVVTSYKSVKDNMNRVEVSFPNKNGEKNKVISGQIIKADKKNNLALIELDKVFKSGKIIPFVLESSDIPNQYILLNNKNVLKTKDYQKLKVDTQSKQSLNNGLFPVFDKKNKIVGAYLDSNDQYIESEKIIKFLANNKVGVYMNNEQRFEIIFSTIAAVNILILYTLLSNKRKKSVRQ